MKRIITVVCFLLGTFYASAQQGKNPSKPVKPVAKSSKQSFLKTLNDSASYVIGASMANFARQYGLPNLDSSSLCSGFTTGMEGKPALFDESTTFRFFNNLTNGIRPAIIDTSLTDAQVNSYLDSISYAIGMDRANFLKQQGLDKMNINLVMRGVKDVMTNQPVAINDVLANNVMNRLITKLQLEKVKPNIEAGKKFLAENKKKPGIRTTKSGIQYEVIKLGTGIKPTALDTFVVHYRGTLLDGTEFDASYNRNEPLRYPMNKVIRGWTEGLQLMPIGSKFKFYIPHHLAYGPFDNPPIPGGSLLVFEIELLDVKKKK